MKARLGDYFLKVAVQAALEAGKIQKKGFRKVHDIQFKGEINLVTEIDKACEAKIIKILSQEFPDHDFLGEESGETRRVKLAQSPADYKWVIDPLDGTTNYAHSYPLFCVSIGLEYKGKVVLGVVYEPNMDQLFVGLKGKGSFRNKKRLKVSQSSRLKRSLLSTGFAYNVALDADNNVARFERFLKTAQAVRRDGVAAMDLCYIAWGCYDGFWELNLYPWDTAAGIVILEEAGGKVTRFDGSAYSIYDKDILASNGKIHKQMLEVVSSSHGK